MRKAVVYIFVIAVIAVLVIAGYNFLKFKPLVDLPQVEAGEPFTRWPGIVVTYLPDGGILIDGEMAGTNAVKALEEELKTLEHRFSHLRQKVPWDYHRVIRSFVPVLVSMAEDTTLDTFFNILDILCRAGCGNIYLAVKNGDKFSAISLCSYHGASIHGFYFWHEEFFRFKEEMHPGVKPTGNTYQIWAEAGKEGRYSFTQVQGPHVVWKWIGTEPKKYPHDSIEPLFEMIEKHRDKQLIIGLDLFKYAKNLSWQWFVELLVELEKTGIRAYLFSTHD